MNYLNELLSRKLRKESDRLMEEGEGKAFTFRNASQTVMEIPDLTRDQVLNGEVYGKYIGPSIREHLIQYLKEYEDMRGKEILTNNTNPHKHYTKREVVFEKIRPLIELLNREHVKYDIGGSYRRGCPLVGDIDILVWETFPDFSEVNAKITAKGDKKIKMVFEDIEVDLRSFEPRHRGCALLYFTGPGNFNLLIRGKAKKMGYKLNEYCLTKVSSGEEFYFEQEEGIFQKLGLKYYSPMEREQWR